MRPEIPLISVAYPHAGSPSLVMMGGECRKDVEGEFEPADVVTAVEQMGAEETPGKFSAQPVTILRLHQPVFDLVVGPDRPGVVVGIEAERRFVAEGHLHTEVGCRGQPIERIGLDSHLLPLRFQRKEAQCDHDQHECFTHGKSDIIR